MTEAIPQYFKDFLALFGNEMRKIHSKLDEHSTEIGAIKSEIGSIKRQVNVINEAVVVLGDEVGVIKCRLDATFEQVGKMAVDITEIKASLTQKADVTEVESLDDRTTKLESFVFRKNVAS